MTMQFFPRRENLDMNYVLFFLLHITSTFSFLPDAIVTGPGLQLQVLKARMIPQQGTVTVFLKYYVWIP